MIFSTHRLSIFAQKVGFHNRTGPDNAPAQSGLLEMQLLSNQSAITPVWSLALIGNASD